MEDNKRNGRFSVEEIKIAYNKLKSTVFYDSGDLLLREQIVEFETNYSKHDKELFKLFFNTDYSKFKEVGGASFFSKQTPFDEKLNIITERLNNYDREPEFFDRFIEKISVQLYPKKFKQDVSNAIISNIRIKENYPVEKVTAFINAPIEIHILSVLWSINDGVKKDAALVEECIGNRLLLKKDKSKIVQGSGLFKPYFSQYQKWRDSAVETAQNLLKNNKNTLFLNLDIKDYYYSVRLPKDYFYKSEKNIDGFYNLNILMEKVHQIFTTKIIKLKIPYDFKDEVQENDEITSFVLPIGLQSSLIIANEYLQDFDKVILDRYKPAYYGRYVDDILLVLSDPYPLDFNEDLMSEYSTSFSNFKDTVEHNQEGHVNFQLNNLNEIEKYIFKNFYPILKVVDSPFRNKQSNFSEPENRVFKLNGYSSLYCQSDKTMIYYFDKNESSIVIDKLKKEIEEKSSEFRDMPNDEDNLIDFEESAYHLLYDGTEDKIRTLKDYKEDRFGLSVYLSHKINVALRKKEKISDEERDKILKLFQGGNCLNFYKLWEKILTLFVVNDNPEAFTIFLFHCLEQIDNISTYLAGAFAKDISGNVRETLTNYLFFAFEMSISLNLEFLNNKLEVSRSFEFKSSEVKAKNFTLLFSDFSFTNPIDKKGGHERIGFRIRKANMMRHHYVSIPLLSYTKRSKSGDTNLIDKDLHIEDYEIDDALLKNSPRQIKFWECCMASAFQELNKFSKKETGTGELLQTDILYDIVEKKEEEFYNEEKEFFGTKTIDINKNYLDIAYQLYVNGNLNHKARYDLDDNLKSKFYNLNPLDARADDFILNQFVVNKAEKLKTPKIAFANTNVLESNIEASVLNSPNLSTDRINKLAKNLNMARKSDADILLFPENFMPMRWISSMGRFSVDNQIMVVSGMEHLTINNYSFNFVITILPQIVDGVKDATVLFRLKNNYSPGEEHLISKHHLGVPKPRPARYEIINWRNIYFSVCYCFELANISHREKLKSKIDLLIGIEWNKDTPYFSNIVEATSRDLHCYVAQVNTSKFGDTRLTQPTETALKDLLKFKGGVNDTILVEQIDISKLRNFQRVKSSINNSKEFKPLPPDFSLEEVLKRIKNK